MKKSENSDIRISVVIPTYNRPEELKVCLHSLLSQTLNDSWEIVVVDDGSTIDLQPLIEALNSSDRIRYIKQKNQGPAMARNVGVAAARGKYIAFLDDDCTTDENWLTQLLLHCQPGVMIGGRTVNYFKDNPYSESSQLLITYLYKYFENTPLLFYTSNNFAVDKKTFQAINGFDVTFPTSAGEDREFCVRWLHKGFKMQYAENALIYHHHELTLSGFSKMHFKYGKASIHFRERINAMGVKIESGKVEFVSGLLKYAMGLEFSSPREKYRMLSCLMLTQIANTYGNVYGLTRSKFKRSTY